MFTSRKIHVVFAVEIAPDWFGCGVVLVGVSVENWLEVVVQRFVDLFVVGRRHGFSRCKEDSGATCGWSARVTEERFIAFCPVIMLFFAVVASFGVALCVVRTRLFRVFVHDVGDGGPVQFGRCGVVVVLQQGAKTVLQDRYPPLGVGGAVGVDYVVLV
jgi:hypothetical protein